MWTLLLIVIICGVIAWILQSTEVPQPFRNIAFAVLLLIIIVAFFQIVLGVTVIPLK